MKVFSNGEWYYPRLRSYEKRSSKILVAKSDALFPGFEVAPFKKKLQDNQTRRSEPDLVMVDKRFSEWYIIEVERSDLLDGHVLPQCEVFADAQSGSRPQNRFLKPFRGL